MIRKSEASRTSQISKDEPTKSHRSTSIRLKKRTEDSLMTDKSVKKSEVFLSTAGNLVDPF